MPYEPNCYDKKDGEGTMADALIKYELIGYRQLSPTGSQSSGPVICGSLGPLASSHRPQVTT